MTMNRKQLDALPLRRKLALAEEARAMFNQMVAVGQEKLTPDSIKAVRELDEQIVKARRTLEVNR